MQLYQAPSTTSAPPENLEQALTHAMVCRCRWRRSSTRACSPNSTGRQRWSQSSASSCHVACTHSPTHSFVPACEVKQTDEACSEVLATPGIMTTHAHSSSAHHSAGRAANSGGLTLSLDALGNQSVANRHAAAAVMQNGCITHADVSFNDIGDVTRHLITRCCTVSHIGRRT